MNILAIDIGTHTGWARTNRNGAVHSGTEKFQHGRMERPGHRWLKFRAFLAEQRIAGEIHAVYYEDVKQHAGTLAALLLWLLVRMNVRERVRRDAADDRARQLAQEQLDSGSAFGLGAANALMGGEFWANPHCTPTGSVVSSRGWHAGWCYGHKMLREVWRAEA